VQRNRGSYDVVACQVNAHLHAPGFGGLNNGLYQIVALNKVAFNIYIGVAIKPLRGDFRCLKQGGGTEIRGKRALSVGRDEGGGRSRRLCVLHQEGADTGLTKTVFEEASVFVVVNLANQTDRRTQLCQGQNCVAGRTASRALAFCSTHALTNLFEDIFPNQVHTAFPKAKLLDYILIINKIKRINQRISYTYYLFHQKIFSNFSAKVLFISKITTNFALQFSNKG